MHTSGGRQPISGQWRIYQLTLRMRPFASDPVGFKHCVLAVESPICLNNLQGADYFLRPRRGESANATAVGILKQKSENKPKHVSAYKLKAGSLKIHVSI